MIEFENVKKVYPNGTLALDGVDLKINDGEFVFIVGSSGAGKSTLMKLLLREEKVTSGTIKVDEFDLARMSNYKVPYYRRQLGVVFQDFRLFQNKTVFENVSFAMRAIGEPNSVIRKRVPAILNIVGLQNKMKCYPKELSGGEQQRVALARALVNNPSIIIADEPTGNLDPELSFDMMNLLRRINRSKNKTVVVITHEKNLVDHFQERVIRLEDGKMIEDRVGGMFE